MKEISVLQNRVQKYAWGSMTAIQSLLNLPKPWNEPAAELWLGAHPKAPSEVWADGQWLPLMDAISNDPVSILGSQAARRFSNKMPFLFKVLAADRPLSVQVHPDMAQATEGFDHENSQDIPLDAPDRNYRDASHKPECLCAVTPFEAMKGFRNSEEILMLMDRVFPTTPLDGLTALKKDPQGMGLRNFFYALMSMPDKRRAQVVSEASKNAAKLAESDRACYWVAQLNREYPEDIGVLSPLFLNVITLAPEEAIYVPAGELHAYLSGVGMEIMASSDNVLRGGLTPKHMDIPELLKIVNFVAAPVQKKNPCSVDAFERIYDTPAEEFQLSKIAVPADAVYESAKSRSVDVLICMEGDGLIENVKTGRSISLKKGVSVIVPAAVPYYRLSGTISLYKGAVKKV